MAKSTKALLTGRIQMCKTNPSIAHIGLATHGRSIQIGSSHVRTPSSILPAGTGESSKMTFASEGFIHAPVGWTTYYLFTGACEHVSDCAGGRYATICERRRGSSAY